MSNLDLYNKVKQPPKSALKEIKGGRLRGMTDISPQWRYESLTDNFGPCGVGWKYEVIKKWLESSEETKEIVANADINLYYKVDGVWSDPIPGTGGSMFCAQEKNGPYTSDEAYKMAITDALSVACKMLGFGADIYAGKWDGSKYKETTATPETSTTEPKKEAPKQVGENKPTVGRMLEEKVLCPEGRGENNMVSPKYCNKGCEFKAKCPTWYPSDDVKEDDISI
jgi:hypothetical protein